MSFSLANITQGAVYRPPRIVLLGVPKVGKSTFGANSDRPIFLPIKGEEGIDGLNVASFPPSQTFADLMSAILSLYRDEHNFGTVVIDSASALEPLIWEAVCRKHNAATIDKVLNGFGKGYTEALYLWRQLTEGLDALRNYKNMTIILIGHVKVKMFNDPNGESYDRYQFNINDKAADSLLWWADSILFANKKSVVRKEDGGFKDIKKGIDVTGGKSFLYTQYRPAHPGGGRDAYGHLPYEMELSWNAYITAVGTAIQQEQTVVQDYTTRKV